MGKNKTAGVDTQDKQVNEKIYGQYLEAFKKGVYNYIKEDYDPATKEITPRKYFSGGTTLAVTELLEIYKNRGRLTREQQEIVGAFLAESPIYNGDKIATVDLVEVAGGGNAVEIAQAAKPAMAASPVSRRRPTRPRNAASRGRK